MGPISNKPQLLLVLLVLCRTLAFMLSEMGSLWRVLGNGMISDFHFDIIIILAAVLVMDWWWNGQRQK